MSTPGQQVKCIFRLELNLCVVMHEGAKVMQFLKLTIGCLEAFKLRQ